MKHLEDDKADPIQCGRILVDARAHARQLEWCLFSFARRLCNLMTHA